MITPANFCKVCGLELKGRSDKKYCNQNCKNKYHKAMLKTHKNEVGLEMSFLLRNRTILKEMLDQENATKRKIKRSALQHCGFRFSNFTGTYTNNQNKQYHYIFDYSWMPFSDQEVLILKR